MSENMVNPEPAELLEPSVASPQPDSVPTPQSQPPAGASANNLTENVTNGTVSEVSEQDLAKGANWKRVHPLTPLANSWAAILVLFAIILSQITNEGALEAIDFLNHIGQAWIAWVVAIAIVVVVLLFILVINYLEWRVTKYALTDQAILFRKGLIFKSERHMRLNRIQAVDVVAPLVPRLLGLAKLHVDSAGAAGSEVDVAYLKVSECQELRAEVLAKAAGMKSNQTLPASAGISKFLEVGESGIMGDLPAASLQAPEVPLYEIPVGMLLGSMLRSLSLWFTVALIPFLFAAGLVPVILAVMDGTEESFIAALLATPSALIGALGGIVAAGSAVFQQLNRGWNFTAAISPDGIRLRHGLTTHDSQTIPPGRVHAVVLKQPFLWRGKDWWQVQLTLAGYQGASSGDKKTQTSTVLLPVGTREQALQALWMVQRDLGAVTDLEGQEIGTAGTDLLQVLMYGSGSAPGLFVPPRRDRWLDWITWNRKAAVLTTTMVMIRDGRVTHRVSFVPHSRMQSVAIDQGPLERKLNLANVSLHLVPGVVPTVVHHLEAPLAERLWELQVRHADIARDQEPPEEWMARVVASISG